MVSAVRILDITQCAWRLERVPMDRWRTPAPLEVTAEDAQALATIHPLV